MSAENNVLQIRGGSAHSDFRLRKRLSDIQALVPEIRDLQAEFVHFVQPTKTGLAVDQQLLLVQLLHYGSPEWVIDQKTMPAYEQHCWVIPRMGTISPWSSKATDIAQICGLPVERLERGICYLLYSDQPLSEAQLRKAASGLYDPMTETICIDRKMNLPIFQHGRGLSYQEIPVLEQGVEVLQAANERLGLALSDDEMNYLVEQYRKISRNPSDVELMMFAQVNSEHCRHKVFRAKWIIDGKDQTHSLFDMIRNTHQKHPAGVLSAYADNAAILEGPSSHLVRINPASKQYVIEHGLSHLVIKVETHNHPTAISPLPGAATGAGGEIRDEGATGQGAHFKAGLTGFTVSHLRVPDLPQPWEQPYGKPAHIASPLQIMLEGPIGGAAFNNEFGRPNLCGYFRTFEMSVKGFQGEEHRGYHKPIMLAGGIGQIRSEHVTKADLPPGTALVVLGGPAMLIGLGGGAASSKASSEGESELDFASVQRHNPEMQRRCQEVIGACCALGHDTPILSIHDVGAGGLCNALPELVNDVKRGANIDLRAILNADPGLSPLEIWCNESQERYVLAIKPNQIKAFSDIAKRERCPFAVVGGVTESQQLKVHDATFKNDPVHVPLPLLFDYPPKMVRGFDRKKKSLASLSWNGLTLKDAAKRVLQFPAVSDKTFLITIGDRSVTGLVCRDQMVGPWQVPVADVAVTATSHLSYTGEAMAMGERSPIALIDPAASGRMAVAEAITNIVAAPIKRLGDIKLSANWMVAAGYPGEDQALFDTVKAIGMELCPELGICIPVGKDSTSMQMRWQEKGENKQVIAPLSLVISAFSPVEDIRRSLTPQLRYLEDDTCLVFIDLARGQQRLGGSVLAQVTNQLGDQCPDLERTEDLKNFFTVIQTLNREQRLLAYHDRSDGGLFATLSEMAFAGHCGLSIDLSKLGSDPLAILFNEELGAVVQIRTSDITEVMARFNEYQLSDYAVVIGKPCRDDKIQYVMHGKVILENTHTEWRRDWSETSYRLQALRDNPSCVREAYDALSDDKDTGLFADLTFDLDEDITTAFNIKKAVKPRVAILREQGVNGHIEMAAAFTRAGFDCVDVHMSDILQKRVDLKDFKGLAACGGFSYGDVLGAGSGWAKSILFHPETRDMFVKFFARQDTFTLGICNGCQMLSQLKSIIPGAEHWPVFVNNASEQFEARLLMTEIQAGPSILLAGMAGSKLPIIVSHGEGRAVFQSSADEESAKIALRYINYRGEVAQSYPANPNGSPMGAAGLTTTDGRVTIFMPHPERVVRVWQHSWHPDHWKEDGPWMRLFRNARVWVG